MPFLHTGELNSCKERDAKHHCICVCGGEALCLIQDCHLQKEIHQDLAFWKLKSV